VPRETKVILEPLEQPEQLVTQVHKEYREFRVKLAQLVPKAIRATKVTLALLE
jgi:hypothetical protein